MKDPARKGELPLIGPCLFVNYLSVNPENLRSSGIRGSGTKLIQFLADRCLREQFSGIYVESLSSAQKFFRKLGFVPINKNLISVVCEKVQPMILTAAAIQETK